MQRDRLSVEEQKSLMALARQALEDGVQGKPWTPLDLAALPPRLREDGASFVTLTIEGGLRGCIGALEYQTPEELLARLRPFVDGVIVADGMRRATFLPQVWEKIPDPAEFLEK